MSDARVQQFLMDFQRWARERADILAAALVGSHARGAARPDSDVDLVILCGHPSQYLSHLSWIHSFGTAERHQLEDYGKVTSVRVWYRDGLEVEYGITDEGWAALPLDPGTQRVISDGMIVLFDPNHILSRHQRTDPAARSPG